jgi:hypothetical protein
MNREISRLLDEGRGFREQAERRLDSACEALRYNRAEHDRVRMSREVQVPQCRDRVNDRHHLDYLHGTEKAERICCGYANRVMAGAGGIISRTGQHWCLARHTRHVPNASARYPWRSPGGDTVSWHGKQQEMHREEIDGFAAGKQESQHP